MTAFLAPIGLPELILLLMVFLIFAGSIAGIIVIARHLARPKQLPPPQATPPPVPRRDSGEGEW